MLRGGRSHQGIVVVFGRTVNEFMLIVGNGADTTGTEGIVLELEEVMKPRRAKTVVFNSPFLWR